ncbi:MAG: FAD-binding oxidoreductase [Verrucomicrobiaceae bacterium]|nr:FAD-binding oxidoreductase [Verrucomicrobiaceae bacterium]
MTANRENATPRLLIVGQGLAGTCLAWQLLWRGIPFLIVDRDEPLSSSKVAAGLISPITGMRLNLNWRYDLLHPEALLFYRRIEKITRQRCFFPRRLVRLLWDERAQELWARRKETPAVQAYLSPRPQDPLVDARTISAPFGGFQQQHAAYVDTAAFLAASRQVFEKAGCWQSGAVPHADIAEADDGIAWAGQSFSHVVWCTGWESANQPLWSSLSHRPARGTVLRLRANIGGERRILNRGAWLLPRADGTLFAGPTYELEFSAPHQPSHEALGTLHAKLQGLVKVPYEVIGSQTAVRPIIQRAKVLIGPHPQHPRQVFFNGLGSKGALRAPWAARCLAEHLLDGTPIEDEIDVRSWL